MNRLCALAGVTRQAFYDYTYYRPRHKRYSYMTGNDVEYTYGTSGNETGALSILWTVAEAMSVSTTHWAM